MATTTTLTTTITTVFKNATDDSGIIPDAVADQGAAIVTGLDWALWTIGRITEFIVLAAVLTVVIVFWKTIVAKISGFCNVGDCCRPRRWKRCLHSVCCCGCCCGGDGLGFQQLAQASHILVVTLVCATNIKNRTSFYLEVWTDPVESASKHSRTKTNARDHCDLECEKLELDWHGDESEVVLRVCMWDASKFHGEDEPSNLYGEIRVPRQRVQGYAQMSQQFGGDITKAARAFNVIKVDPKTKNLKSKSELDPVSSIIYTQISQSMGVKPVDEAEVERLREENRSLKTQVQRSRRPIFAEATKQAGDEEENKKDEVLMKVVLKFEIQVRKVQNFEISEFRSSSFDMRQEESGATHA